MTQARDLADLAGAADAGTITGRNLIINGAMTISQRGTSQASLGYNAGYFAAPDRFKYSNLASGPVYTVSQSTEAPDGFSNSYKWDCTTADTSIAAAEYTRFQHFIEAQNLQHLQYGTSGAKSVTLSFWVRSNVTGDYAVSLYQNDDVRVIGSTYTINSADTWEHKTMTFAGDTVGVIDNDNGAGLTIDWFLSAGSDQTSTDNTSWAAWALGRMAYGHNVNMASSTSNEWYITGIQLEVGSTATDFEHEDFGTTLRKCQRYFCKSYDSDTAVGTATSNGRIYFILGGPTTTLNKGAYVPWPVEMRATPTVVGYNDAGTSGQFNNSLTFLTVLNGKRGTNAYSSATSSVEIHGHITAEAEI